MKILAEEVRRAEAIGRPTGLLDFREQREAGTRGSASCKPPGPRPASGGTRVKCSVTGTPHQLSVTEMAKITKAIVEIEGPIHEEEIARRVTALFGKSRTGSLIGAATQASLQPLKQTAVLVQDGRFWMTPGQAKKPPIRDRSNAPSNLQKAEMLSPVEIRAAAKIALEENGTLSADEMATAVTRLLGFRRTGPDLKVAIDKAMQTP